MRMMDALSYLDVAMSCKQNVVKRSAHIKSRVSVRTRDKLPVIARNRSARGELELALSLSKGTTATQLVNIAKRTFLHVDLAQPQHRCYASTRWWFRD
jgi:hypothetical protein